MDLPDYLADIVAYKKTLLEKKKGFFASLQKNIRPTRLTRYHVFRDALSQPGRVNLIAEIKKASPSRGVIRDDFNVLKIADAYVQNGAVAISVLTEDKYFLGKPAYLKQVADRFSIPLLAKDFIIDVGQVYEAFLCGASAVLLIAAILSDQELKNLLAEADHLDLDCLVEVHEERELERALACGAQIIGVNNRDLRSFQVDLRVSERLLPRIPEGKVRVAESGIQTREDVRRLEAVGAQAVLIGETFLRAADIGAKIKDVMG